MQIRPTAFTIGLIMQIRPTAFTIGLIIHFSIALFCVYTEFGIDSTERKDDLIHTCQLLFDDNLLPTPTAILDTCPSPASSILHEPSSSSA